MTGMIGEASVCLVHFTDAPKVDEPLLYVGVDQLDAHAIADIESRESPARRGPQPAAR